MNKSQHTPEPWFVHVGDGSLDLWEIRTGRPGDNVPFNGDPIVSFFEEPSAGAGGVEGKANAEFIVRACNAHEQLLATCQEFADAVIRGDAELKAQGILSPACVLLASHHARAAIAKAEGGE